MTDLTLKRYWRILQGRDVTVVVAAADETEHLLAGVNGDRLREAIETVKGGE